MAKTITIEFTDAQWELALAHFRVVSDGKWVEFSEDADFITELKRHVQEEIERVIANKAYEDSVKAAKGAFDA
jgi:hypothetical protein